jgi:hypothetical protein
VGREELIEMALQAGIGVVNTRFHRPSVIEPSKGRAGVLFLPSVVSEHDVALVQEWLTGLRAKQEVAC